jgi:hypothetical protein
MSPLQASENPGFYHVSSKLTAVDTAVEPKIDPNMQRILDAWPTLPEAIRAGILAMIDAARK